MDLTLRCNSLKCRAHLNDRAVVTTCRQGHPACRISIDTDIVQPHLLRNMLRQPPLVYCDGRRPRVSSLRYPSYKCRRCRPDNAEPVGRLQDQRSERTVAWRHHGVREQGHGLFPISDGARDVSPSLQRRGQTRFDTKSTYQEYMSKNLTDKYGVLNSQMDSVINDATAETTSLRDKLSSLSRSAVTFSRRADSCSILERQEEPGAEERRACRRFPREMPRTTKATVDVSKAQGSSQCRCCRRRCSPRCRQRHPGRHFQTADVEPRPCRATAASCGPCQGTHLADHVYAR